MVAWLQMCLDVPGCSGRFATVMRPNSQPGVQPGDRVLPRINVDTVTGVRLLPIKQPRAPGRPLPKKPYGVEWDNPGGIPRRPSAFFESTELLERKVIELNAAKKQGNVALVPTSDEIAEWRVFKAKIGKVTPLEVYAGWRAWTEKTGHAPCALRVDKAVDDYLAEEKKRLGSGEPDAVTKKRKGQTLDANSYRQKRCKLLRFKAEFGLAMMDEPTGPGIEDWLDSLEMVKASDTFNDHVKQIRSLYYHYPKVVANSPTSDIKMRDDMTDKVRVIPVKDIAKLLVFAKDKMPYLLPRLACEVFCGLRFTSASKLTRDLIKLDTKTLVLPKWIMKTKSEHRLQCVPENFWDWAAIGHDDDRCWEMTPSDYMHAKSSLFESAEVVNPGNGLRHTMPSRHVAAYNDPGLIARILCHRDQQKLWDTYLGVSTPEEGWQHFMLRPGNAARAAAGERLPVPARTSRPRARESSRAGQRR